ncbi:unnamed protein product [Rotaria magnacalcarata]
MELSLFYFAFIPFILLSTADSTEVDSQCSLPRRLLSLGGFSSPSAEKKSHSISTSSKSPAASPPKYARTMDAHGLTVYVQPETSKVLGQKGRSYTHLLKSKSHGNEEKLKLKQSQIEKKKQLKKKNSTRHKSSGSTKTKELVVVNDDDLHRCETLLRIDSTSKVDKKSKQSRTSQSNQIKMKSPKIKNATNETTKIVTKNAAAASKPLPVDDKKAKVSKINSKTNPDEKKKSKKPLVTKTSEDVPLTPSVNNIPIKTTSSPPKPTKNKKSQEVIPETVNTINETTESSSAHPDGVDNGNEKQHPSVVGRAYHFVKNVFQLSDDALSDNHTHKNPIIDLTDEHQQYQSRKLLSINDDVQSMIMNNDKSNDEFDLYSSDKNLNSTTDDDLSFVAASISKRHLLSVKKNKQSMSSKSANGKENKSNPGNNVTKPKVGWAYRYRISRYNEAQKIQQNKNKIKGEGKSKHSQQQRQSKSKRKLLEYDSDQDSSWDDDDDDLSNQNTANTITITETFVPKRQLLKSKRKDKDEQTTNKNENDPDKTYKFRRMKSLEESTDPILIVQSYDSGLYKPRVGWQFRYRVSRYIDSLRESIREDQERLKLGLQAIKRKTPQELSGRRKRVLDKPFTSDPSELKKQPEQNINTQENKPNVGWRYRYRINKMVEAKKRGDYVDDEKEKREESIKEKTKPISPTKHEDVEIIERENERDPELRQINDEGRRVGWAYRYRIRRKLDHLKQQQTESGIAFDLGTLSTKFDKNVVEPKPKSKPKPKPTEEKVTEPIIGIQKNNTKSVGWQYRYRVSKMNETLKQNKSKTSKKQNQDQTSTDPILDSDLSKLTPEERSVGWKYRYRIRRKIDSLNSADHRDNEKHSRKRSSKNDIHETPFMEYFRRASSHIVFGLLPVAKKSVCILPLPITFSFCEEEQEEEEEEEKQEEHDDQSVQPTEKSKKIKIKKLKTKKEHRAKQFIRSHRTKLGADDKDTERRVDETMRTLYKKPSLPPPQTPLSTPNNEKSLKTKRKQQSKKPNYNEQKNHFHEEHSINKKIGVETKKNKNKKKFQLLGKKIKTKRKQHTFRMCPFAMPPAVKTPTTTATTTQPPRLRTLSEFIQEEASTLFGGTHISSKKYENINDEIEEVNEIIQERSKLEPVTPSPPPPPLPAAAPMDSELSSAEDHSTLSNNESKIIEEYPEKKVDDMLDLENDHNSS